MKEEVNMGKDYSKQECITLSHCCFAEVQTSCTPLKKLTLGHILPVAERLEKCKQVNTQEKMMALVKTRANDNSIDKSTVQLR